jgi:PKD repeat protein
LRIYALLSFKTIFLQIKYTRMKILASLKSGSNLLFTALLLLISIVLFSCTKDTTTAPDPLPNAGFSYTSARVFPVQVTFTNTSSGPFPVVSSIWDFGDGSFSTVINPTHAYPNSGTYLIRLVQQYSNSTRDTIIKALQLNVNGPSGISSKNNSIAAADFTFSIASVYLATFTNTSTNATAYLWDFGDATNSTSAATTLTHQYNAAGPFTVKLKATGPGGTDSCSAQIVF